VIALLLIAAAVVLLVILIRRKGTGMRAAERRLRRKLGPATADSLIEFELNQEPGLSRGEAAARALDRIIYDRTR